MSGEPRAQTKAEKHAIQTHTQTHRHTQTHTQTQTQTHTHTHTHTHRLTDTHTHTHTDTRTHTQTHTHTDRQTHTRRKNTGIQRIGGKRSLPFARFPLPASVTLSHAKYCAVVSLSSGVVVLMVPVAPSMVKWAALPVQKRTML